MYYSILTYIIGLLLFIGTSTYNYSQNTINNTTKCADSLARCTSDYIYHKSLYKDETKKRGKIFYGTHFENNPKEQCQTNLINCQNATNAYKKRFNELTKQYNVEKPAPTTTQIPPPITPTETTQTTNVLQPNCNSLVQENNFLKQRINALEQEKNTLQSDNTRLQQMKQTLSQEKNSLQNNNASFIQQISVLENERNQLYNDNTKLTNDNRDLLQQNDKTAANYKRFIQALIRENEQSYGMTYFYSDVQNQFDAYVVNIAKNSIVFYHNNAKGKPYGNFNSVNQLLHEKNKQLIFATNGGMFHANRNPVGLYIEQGATKVPINLKDNTGNFFLKPNGVFYIDKQGKVGVKESEAFNKLRLEKNAQFATQSGPMLVIDRAIHPKFNQNSTNKRIRSGVGIIDDNHLVFIISKQPVNFYNFAHVFRDFFGCDNALFLDGAISQMYLPELNRNDNGSNYSIIIGVSEKLELTRTE